MKRKILIVFTLFFLSLLFFVSIHHLKNKKNTTIYISEQRRTNVTTFVKFYIDDVLKDTINLKKHYDLNLYVYKDNLTIGKHIIELRTLNNEIYAKENFYYLGLVNWIVIGCYGKENYSFNKYFNKPLFL